MCFLSGAYSANSEENYFDEMPSKMVGSMAEKDLESILVLHCKLFISGLLTDI